VAFSAATTAAINTAAISQLPARSSAGCHTAKTPVPIIALTPIVTAPPRPNERASLLGGSVAAVITRP